MNDRDTYPTDAYLAKDRLGGTSFSTKEPSQYQQQFHALREAVYSLTGSVDAFHNKLLGSRPEAVGKSDRPEPYGVIAEMTFGFIELRAALENARSQIEALEGAI